MCGGENLKKILTQKLWNMTNPIQLQAAGGLSFAGGCGTMAARQLMHHLAGRPVSPQSGGRASVIAGMSRRHVRKRAWCIAAALRRSEMKR